jgi:DNA-binding response OmpR family regulator
MGALMLHLDLDEDPGLSGSRDLDRLRRLLEEGGLKVLDLRIAANRSRRADVPADVVIARNDVAMVQAVKQCRALNGSAPVILIVQSDAFDEEIVVGEFRLRPMQNVLRIGERSVALQKIEADILAALMSHAGQAISFELLRDILQRPHGATRGSIAVHICNLRQKLEEQPDTPCHLITIRGRGYSFLP